MKQIDLTYKNTFPILILLFMVTAFGQAQIKQTKLDINDIPKGIKLEGKFKSAIRWTDSLGDNIIVTTETGEYPSKVQNDKSYRDAELFAYHFISKGDSIKQSWRVYDFIKACPLDIEANFVKNTLQVTDINNDGIGEVWLMYKTVCHGDVSPCNMKIIMYQGNQKFAM